MSKYTTEVRYICENYAGLKESVGFDEIDNVLDKSVDKVFNFDFPIFDESYRKILCKKILMHYYTREICEETVGLWKARMWSKLNLIMPYYNQLYKSALLEFNPFYDVDLTRDHVTTNTGDIKSNSVENETSTSAEATENTGSSDSWNLYSDTPQGGLTGVKNENYLTNAGHDYGTVSSKGETEHTGEADRNISTNTNTNSLENYIEHVKGKQGTISYSKMLKEFRETFLNIDEEIIKELSPLFFNLW